MLVQIQLTPLIFLIDRRGKQTRRNMVYDENALGDVPREERE